MVPTGAFGFLFVVFVLDVRYVVDGARGKHGRSLSCVDASLPIAKRRMHSDRVELPSVNETALPGDDSLGEIRMTSDDLEAWMVRQDVTARCTLVRLTGDVSWIGPDDQFTFTARESHALLRHFNGALFDIPDLVMGALRDTLNGPDIRWHRAFASVDVVLSDVRRPGALVNALDADPTTQPIRLAMKLFYDHGHDVLSGNTSLPMAVAGLPDKVRAKRAVHVLARLQVSCKATRRHGSVLYEAVRRRNYHLVPLLLDFPFALDPLIERGPQGELPHELLDRIGCLNDPEVDLATDLLYGSMEADDAGEAAISDAEDDDGDDGVLTLTASRRLHALMDQLTLTSTVPTGDGACTVCRQRLSHIGPGQHLAILHPCWDVLHWECARPWFQQQARDSHALACPACQADPTNVCGVPLT